ncbi:hypothetical protein KAI92_01225 [Candidatus Parcubacteria bacterium]|nr:hypothetical protein [Candidatus Parcubacteria bacterium]
MKEEILAPYKKTCSKCKKIKLVPKNHEYCLKCLRLMLNLASWEIICLQCGKKTPGSKKDKDKFCQNCISENSKKSAKNLIASFDDTQVILFDQFLNWHNIRTGNN